MRTLKRIDGTISFQQKIAYKDGAYHAHVWLADAHRVVGIQNQYDDLADFWQAPENKGKSVPAMRTKSDRNLSLEQAFRYNYLQFIASYLSMKQQADAQAQGKEKPDIGIIVPSSVDIVWFDKDGNEVPTMLFGTISSDTREFTQDDMDNFAVVLSLTAKIAWKNFMLALS